MRFLLFAILPITLLAADPPEWQTLFKEDFEHFNPDAWKGFETEDGVPWTVTLIDGNRVYAGSGHSFTTLKEGFWADYRLRVRVRLARGSAHINYRYSSTRYYVRLEPEMVSLNRSLPPNVRTRLVTAATDFQLGRWYDLEIVGVGPQVRVYLDGALKIDFHDDAPLLGGGVSFESLPDAQVEIDDVEVIGPAARAMPAWVRTGGPLGGIGYDVRVRRDNPDLWFATDASSGVHRSIDGGLTWFPSNQGILNRTGQTGDGVPIFCLTVDPNNPDIVWAGTQNSRGVYKSTDGGQTWASKERGITENNGITFRGFSVDPRDSQIVYAAAEISPSLWAGKQLLGREFDLTKGVVYKTVDGGENWTAVWRGDNLARYVWINPRDPDTVYVSTGFWDREAANTDPARQIPGGVGVLKSTDGGRNWRVLNEANGLLNLYVGSLFMHPENPETLLAAAGNAVWPENSGIYLSTDGGEHWRNTIGANLRRQISDRFTAVEYVLADPRIAYAATGHNFLRSSDGGASWELVAGGNGAPFGPEGIFMGQPSDLEVDPRDPSRIFLNNYNGGNFLTEDGGRTWANASRGYTGAAMSDVAVDAADQGKVWAVARSGSFLSRNGGADWQGLVPGAEWYTVLPGVAGGAVLLADEMSGRLWRGSGTGREWKEVFRHPAVTGNTFGQRHGFKALAVAPTNPLVVYGGMARDRRQFDLRTPEPSFGFFKSTDGGLTWREANDEGTARIAVNVLVVDPRSEDIAYAGTATRGVLRTLDGGRSWSPLNVGLRTLDVRSLAIDANDFTVLYAGTEAGGLYKTTDAGDNWKAAGAGMDSAAMVRDIVIDPADSNVVYAADVRSGVYRSEDGGKLWVQINRGLRTRAVRALAISSSGGTLYAATEGEGVFRLDIQPYER